MYRPSASRPAFPACLLLAAALCGCAKEYAVTSDTLSEDPIVFGEAAPDTRSMAERTQAKGFTCFATRGTGTFISNAVTSDYGAYQAPLDPMYYWPLGGTLSFYGILPGTAMENSAGRVSAKVGSAGSPLTGSEDYIAAFSPDVPAGRGAVPMSFRHILSAVGSISVTSGPQIPASVVSVSITHPSYGTYCLTDGQWSGLSGTRTTSFAALFGSVLADGRHEYRAAGSLPLSVIPGCWQLDVTYDETLGGVGRRRSASTSVNLEAGHRSSISAQIEPDGRLLAVCTGVTAWADGGSWIEDGCGDTAPDRSCDIFLGYPFGNGWTESAYQIGGRPVYCSDNAGMSDSTSGACISIQGYEEFSFHVLVSGEANYDYLLVGTPGEELFQLVHMGTGWLTADSMERYGEVHSVVSRTGTPSDNPADLNQYTKVTFSGLDPGEIYDIQLVYGKDGSLDKGLDRAFLFIP